MKFICKSNSIAGEAKFLIIKDTREEAIEAAKLYAKGIGGSDLFIETFEGEEVYNGRA